MINITCDTNGGYFQTDLDLKSKHPIANKIHFIKMVRDETGCGLKEAKDFADSLVEFIVAEMNKLRPYPAPYSVIVKAMDEANPFTLREVYKLLEIDPYNGRRLDPPQF